MPTTETTLPDPPCYRLLSGMRHLRQGCSSSPCSGQLVVQLVLSVPGLLEGLLPSGRLLLCRPQPSVAALLQGQDAERLQSSNASRQQSLLA